MTVLRRLLRSQQAGLVLIIAGLMVALSLAAGSHVDESTGATVNNFFNSYTLIQTATDASFIAIMAVGATVVIISAGIDLSVGSVYALAGRGDGPGAARQRRRRRRGLAGPARSASASASAPARSTARWWSASASTRSSSRSAACGSCAASPSSPARPRASCCPNRWLTSPSRRSGLGTALYPVPMLAMLAVAALGALYLERTVMGRHVFALGGNAEASRYSGLRLARIQIGVYVLAGATAGLAAFLGASFYGSVSCGDATGYELYVIASAVVGGARLSGGRGSAINAMLGAVLIVLIRQSIRTLHLDQNYEWIIIGCAIVVAVVLDQASARFAARRLAEGAKGEMRNARFGRD